MFLGLAVILPVLFAIDLGTGSTQLGIGEVCHALFGGGDMQTGFIVRDIRLVKALVAVMAGVALAVSGLQMQTLFGNPLAGPYVLGVTSGATLGVALFVLSAPLLTWLPAVSGLGMAGAAWIGAFAVLALVALAGVRLKDNLVLLVLGMMLSSAIGAVVQILQYLSSEQALKMFVVWTMGSLGDVTSPQLWLLLAAVLVGLVLAVITLKPLNLLLLGEQYARTMGIDIKRSRLLILLSTTLLAGTVTAFCGPIGFVGLAVPHIARVLFAEADCRIILPASALVGICLMLVCDIAARTLMLPINSITALVGIPVVVWIVLKR